MATYERPAPDWLDPDDLDPLVRALAAAGVVAEVSLRRDGTVVVVTDVDVTDETWAGLVPVLAPERVADDTVHARLAAYLDLAAPTGAQTVAATKDLVRAVRHLARR